MEGMFDPGRYKAKLISGELCETQNGKPQWALTFSVGEYERTAFLSLSGGAAPYTIQKLQRLGFNGDVDNPRFADAAYTDGVELNCKHDTYKGETREDWDLAAGLQLTPPSTDTRSSFQKMWRANNAPAPTGRPTTPPPRATAPVQQKPPPVAETPPGPPPDDDVPPEESPVVARTKDEAWAYWCAGAKDGQPNVNDWKKVLSDISVKTNLPQSKFTATEWQAVADARDIPF